MAGLYFVGRSDTPVPLAGGWRKAIGLEPIPSSQPIAEAEIPTDGQAEGEKILRDRLTIYPRLALSGPIKEVDLAEPIRLSETQRDFALTQPGLYIVLGGPATGKTILMPAIGELQKKRGRKVRRHIIDEPAPGRTFGGAAGLSIILDDFYRSDDEIEIIDSLKAFINTGGNATAGGIPREFFSIIDGIDAATASLGKVVIASVNPLLAPPADDLFQQQRQRVDAYVNVKAALLGACRGVISIAGYPVFDGREGGTFTMSGVEASIRPASRAAKPISSWRMNYTQADPDAVTNFNFDLN